MLSELQIRNFAIIDDIHLQFAPGFNVLTGETGAGKSIILDAMMLVLGERADTTMIRAGCTEAFVEATFDLSAALQKALNRLLEKEGLETGSDEGLVLARELRENGRTIARVNGRSVNLSLLRQIAAPLIDIHGQGEHLSLLKPRSHLPLLDVYGGLVGERTAVAQQVSHLQTIQKELESLRQDERFKAQRLDMLQYQIQEISTANLQEGEEEELRAERTRLANAEQLIRAAGEAVAQLIGAEDDVVESIADRLGLVERSLTQLAKFDETQTGKLEQLQGLAFQLGELAEELQNYLEELEFNPDRLGYVEERLELIHTLKRKYGNNIPAILAAGAQARDELKQITHSEERIAELVDLETAVLRQIGQLAAKLSQKRKAAALKLSRVVERQLTELYMDGTKFQVDFHVEPQANGAFVGEERLAFDRTGIDRAEFLISPNPGEPLKPMAKVASGGETARLMLALKTALTEADATPTLIFDEIDQGIGGRVGNVVGRKLWRLTSRAQHQVIVVTHLPQLAGYGDAHFVVSKRVNDGRTTTAVTNLDTNGRIDELAAMLGTQEEHARAGAAAILQQAQAAKAGE
ncbi:MAG: DNA repair protein RecN [Anaerolineae bacterium]